MATRAISDAGSPRAPPTWPWYAHQPIRDADRRDSISFTGNGWDHDETKARLDTRRDHDMRRMFFATVLTVLVGAGSAAAQSTIAFGPHDFSGGSAIRNTHANIKGQTRVFCHTPHEGAAAGPPWEPNPTTPTPQGPPGPAMD